MERDKSTGMVMRKWSKKKGRIKEIRIMLKRKR
jgi:hypothetical protein